MSIAIASRYDNNRSRDEWNAADVKSVSDLFECCSARGNNDTTCTFTPAAKQVGAALPRHGRPSLGTSAALLSSPMMICAITLAGARPSGAAAVVAHATIVVFVAGS